MQHASSKAFYRSNTPYELSQDTYSCQQPDIPSYLPLQNPRLNPQRRWRYKFHPLILNDQVGFHPSQSAHQLSPIQQPSLIPEYSEPYQLSGEQRQYYRTEASQCSNHNCYQCQSDYFAHRVPSIQQHLHYRRPKQYFPNDLYEPQYTRKFWPSQEQYLPRPLSQCSLPQHHPQNRPILHQRKTAKSSTSSLSPASSSSHFVPSFMSSNGSEYNSGSFM